RARKNPTEAEKAMWNILRRGFSEFGFRREVSFRHYRADFASHSAKLVIEADGGQHSTDVDAERSAVIEADGYTILRFWNNDILGNPDGVAQQIAEHLRHAHPHPPTR
ncbi:MAG: endonuclease domain-containing protein, partial [Sphingomonadales bacterium]